MKAQLEQTRIFNATPSFNKISDTKVLSKWTYFNGVYSRNDLPKIKDGAYGINLDELKSVGTDWIALYVNGNNIIYLDSFGVEHIPKGIKKSIGNKNIMISIYRIQAYNSMMFEYFILGLLILC